MRRAAQGAFTARSPMALASASEVMRQAAAYSAEVRKRRIARMRRLDRELGEDAAGPRRHHQERVER